MCKENSGEKATKHEKGMINKVGTVLSLGAICPV